MMREPTVTVHYAQTLDGRIATLTGQSQWIGGQSSLELAHQLRSQHGAVMVGVGTVLSDNPRLTVRLVQGKSPLRIVCDSTLRIPLNSMMFEDEAAETVIATTGRAARKAIETVQGLGAQVLVLKQDGEGRVDLRALLGVLAKRGIDSVLVEGGRGLITSIIRLRLADRLVICMAPKLLGTGIEAIGDLGILRLSEALRCADIEVRRMGDDVIFDGRLERVVEAHV